MVLDGSSLELRFRRAQETSGQLMVYFIVLGLWWRKEMVKFHFYFFLVFFVLLFADLDVFLLVLFCCLFC